METAPIPDELDELQALAAELKQALESWRSVGMRAYVPSPPWRPPADSPAMAQTSPSVEQSATMPRPATPAPRPEESPVVKPVSPLVAPSVDVPAEPVLDLWSAYAPRKDPAVELERIRQELGDCQRCALAGSRKNIVFGVGSPKTDLVLVGEAPGADEDDQGEPFVGAAGQMLTRMIQNVLLRERETVYILNVLKCRPPGNRDPHPDEVQVCRRFMEAQIAAINPKVILTLGRHAVQTLLKTKEGIKSMRGQWRSYGGIPVMPTFHPAYLMRLEGAAQIQEKRAVMSDLVAIRERLRGP